MNNRVTGFLHVMLLRIVPAVASLFMASCAEPPSMEKFVRNSGRDCCGRYVFEVDMSDSSSVYSIDIYSAFTCRDEVFSGFTSLPLNLMWEAPGKTVYEENVLLAGRVSSYSHFGKNVSSAYRRGLRPVENGIWKLYLTVPEDSVSKYGITGAGLKITKEQWDMEN
ncbi:MAG: hypothetical protein ACI3ZC_02525 [Candidatus Cryptobacteroides sp.]